MTTSSWNERGLSATSEDKVPIKKALPDVAKKLVLVADSTQYGKVNTYFSLPLKHFDEVITDKTLPDDITEILQNHKIDLITDNAGAAAY